MKHTLSGIVIEGNHIGRSIGSPTINISMADQEAVMDGVYAGHVSTSDGTYHAMINIGRRPTLGAGLCRLLEAHLIGFDGILYGQQVEVTLLQFIRPEHRFDSLDRLQEQIATDREQIEQYFRTHADHNE